MNERAIPYSKAKVLLRWFALLIGATIFEYFIYVGRVVEANNNNKVYFYAAHLLVAVIFIWVSYYGLRTIFHKNPGLVFSSSGFYDNSSGSPAGFVPWSDVAGIRQSYIPAGKGRIRVVLVGLRNPSTYISKGTKAQSVSKKISHHLLGSAVVISSSLLKVSHTELVTIFEDYLVKHGRNT